jgi:peptide deformylase
MIFPILAYGHPNLRKISEDITPDYPDLERFIEEMFDTMYKTSGVGLAAPQINKQIRVFVIDTTPFAEEFPETKGFKKVFINAQMLDEYGEEVSIDEGCLSVPGIRGEVMRFSKIKIRYQDENFTEHVEEYEGMIARVIQHEYDHLEGILFVDHFNNLRKMRIKKKLNNIKKGEVNIDYRMIFPKKIKRR